MFNNLNDLSPAAPSTGDFYAEVEMYQPNEIFISQLKYYLSGKWEYLAAKLRGGWRPKPGASWPNHYIGNNAGMRAIINHICE